MKLTNVSLNKILDITNLRDPIQLLFSFFFLLVFLFTVFTVFTIFWINDEKNVRSKMENCADSIAWAARSNFSPRPLIYLIKTQLV